MTNQDIIIHIIHRIVTKLTSIDKKLSYLILSRIYVLPIYVNSYNIITYQYNYSNHS